MVRETFEDLLTRPSVQWGTFHMCMYEQRDPITGKLYYKPTTLMHNLPKEVMKPIFKKCPAYAGEKAIHEHEVLQGKTFGLGNRTAFAQVYPYKFCLRLADIMAKFLRIKNVDQNTFLLTDIFEICFTENELQSFSSAADNRSSGEHPVLSVHNANGEIKTYSDLKPIKVTHNDVRQLMVDLNRLPKGTEVFLHQVTEFTRVLTALFKGTQALRKAYIPNNVFYKCIVLRGTLGEQHSMAHSAEAEAAYVFMWRK